VEAAGSPWLSASAPALELELEFEFEKISFGLTAHAHYTLLTARFGQMGEVRTSRNTTSADLAPD
jgi:hypothetical protein